VKLQDRRMRPGTMPGPDVFGMNPGIAHAGKIKIKTVRNRRLKIALYELNLRVHGAHFFQGPGPNSAQKSAGFGFRPR